MKKSIYFIVLLAFACSSPDESEKGAVFEQEGIALAGYDPVAYFEQAEAKLGTSEESTEYQGLTYLFSSTKNKELFLQSPERYLPAYGGWCAYAVAEGNRKMEPDPTMWQIQDGRLQLFYDDWMTNLTGNLKETWNEDPETYAKKPTKTGRPWANNAHVSPVLTF